jgi:hypothetical protein
LFVKPVTAATVYLQQAIVENKYLLHINLLRRDINLADETRPAGSGRRKFGRICQRLSSPRRCGQPQLQTEQAGPCRASRGPEFSAVRMKEHDV